MDAGTRMWSYAHGCGVSPLLGVTVGGVLEAPVNIQFTSGTTGAAKAATLTHHNMVNNAAVSARILKFGATIVFPAAGFDAEATLLPREAAVEIARERVYKAMRYQRFVSGRRPEKSRVNLVLRATA